MTELGRLIILAGMGLLVLGLAIWGLGKAGCRGMPGDIRYESEHTRVYLPIATCVVISIVGTAVLWAWRWLTKR